MENLENAIKNKAEQGTNENPPLDKIEEAKTIEFPFHATHPKTGVVEGFKTEKEMQEWIDKTREELQDNNP